MKELVMNEHCTLNTIKENVHCFCLYILYVTQYNMFGFQISPKYTAHSERLLLLLLRKAFSKKKNRNERVLEVF